MSLSVNTLIWLLFKITQISNKNLNTQSAILKTPKRGHSREVRKVVLDASTEIYDIIKKDHMESAYIKLILHLYQDFLVTHMPPVTGICFLQYSPLRAQAGPVWFLSAPSPQWPSGPASSRWSGCPDRSHSLTCDGVKAQHTSIRHFHQCFSHSFRPTYT